MGHRKKRQAKPLFGGVRLVVSTESFVPGVYGSALSRPSTKQIKFNVRLQSIGGNSALSCLSRKYTKFNARLQSIGCNLTCLTLEEYFPKMFSHSYLFSPESSEIPSFWTEH